MISTRKLLALSQIIIFCYYPTCIGLIRHYWRRHKKYAVILASLVPSPLHARARKGLVKRVALPCPRGTYIAAQSDCRTMVT